MSPSRIESSLFACRRRKNQKRSIFQSGTNWTQRHGRNMIRFSNFPAIVHRRTPPRRNARATAPIDIRRSQTNSVHTSRSTGSAIPAAAQVPVSAHDYDAGGKPACSWDDPQTRDELITGLVHDALAVLDALDDAELDPDHEPLVALLALVAGQDVRLVPHAATRWHHDAQHPVTTIWSANRTDPAIDPGDIDWQGEAALFTRPQAEVQWQAISHGACCFLDACREGQPVTLAAALAQAQEPDLDVAALLAQLLLAGAFTAFTFH